MPSTNQSRDSRQSSSRSTGGAALRKTVASTLSPETILDIVQRLGLMDMVAPLTGLPVELYGPARGPNGERFEAAFATVHGQVGSDELAARMAERPIFASPSLYEPFGLAVLEAAQAGCPLVLSDIPTFRELWDGAARFAPPGDAAAFAGAVSALLADEAERERLAAAARIRADRYGLDAMVEGVAAVHRAVVRTPAEAAA